MVEEPPEAVSEEHVESTVKAGEQRAEVTLNPTSAVDEVQPLRSRKTKPINWKAVVTGSILLVSIVVPIVLLTADSASRLFACGLAQTFMHDEAGAIESYTKAIAIRKDGVFYKVRAAAYAQQNPPNLEGEYNDLLASLQLNTLDYATLDDAITLASRLGHHDTAVKLSRDLANFYSGFSKDKHPYRYKSSYNLLLLGDEKYATELLTAGTKGNDETAVRALVLRETQPLAAKEYAKKDFGEYCSFFALSYRTRNIDGTMVPEILKSLFLLDDKKPQEAAACLAKLRSDATVDLRGYPIINLLDAWASYEQGDLDKCLKLTEPLIKVEKMDRDSDYEDLANSIEGLNMRAAAHLLRQHVYLDRNETQQAENEKRNYQNMKNSGKVFVPIPYRNWLDKK